jgi:hypothetical protein
MPVLCDNQGQWLYDESNQCPGRVVAVNDEMRELKARWAQNARGRRR